MSILDTDLQNVETGMPLIAEGSVVDVTIAKIESVPNSSQTGDVLKIDLKLAQNGTDDKGNTINVGFPLFDRISLVETERYNPQRRLAEFKEAVLGTKAGGFNPLSQYEGKTVKVKVGIRTDEKYPPQNVIRRYIAK